MLGKTHSLIGAAASTVIMQPRDLKELVMCVTLGSIGGLIPDIDMRNSEADKHTKDLLTYAGATGIVALIYFFLAPDKIIKYLQHIDLTKLVGLLIIILLLCIGMMCKHRGFTHSVEFALLIAFSVFMLTKSIVVPLGIFIGILSHDLADLLNKKKVLLVATIKYRKCFGICDADSKISSGIALCSIFLIILYCVTHGLLLGLIM